MGGWGAPGDDYQITTGAFATDYPLTYPSLHRLRRQYTPTAPGTNGTNVTLTDLFTPESQIALVNSYEANFIRFQQTLEGGSHGAVHRIVGAYVNPNSLCYYPFIESTQRPCGYLSFDRPP
jgi:tyrosinase